MAFTTSTAIALAAEDDDIADEDGEMVVGLTDFRVVKRTLPSS